MSRHKWPGGLVNLEAPVRRAAPSKVAPAPPQLRAGPVPPDEIRFRIPAMRLEFVPEPRIEGLIAASVLAGSDNLRILA